MTNGQPLLVRTRAEEHEDDVWGEFFIPPYFSKLNLKNRKKPLIVQGGRGCGKTMFLKYLHYKTSFSKKRSHIDPSEANHVGIYWRVDTQFCNALVRRGLELDEWHDAFEHYVALLVTREITLALQSIAESNFVGFTTTEFESLRLIAPHDYLPHLPASVAGLRSGLETLIRQFEMWCRNVRSTPRSAFLPGHKFLLSLIREINQKVPALAKTTFHVYLDEFENLVPYQVEIMNTYLKHSASPLIFNLAMKRGAVNNTMTTGAETIDGGHDFETADIEALLNPDSRALFFAEVILGTMQLTDEPSNQFIESLIDANRLPERVSKGYEKSLLAEARRIFPGQTHTQIADATLAERPFKKLLNERLTKALKTKSSQVTLSQLFDAAGDHNDALVILPALLNREALTGELILEQLIALRNERPNSFDGDGGWLHNNLFGALLELYRPYGRRCPLYSGFDSFCTISSGNLRHFLSLCSKAIERTESFSWQSACLSLETQAEAAYETSLKFLNEIRTFGPSGEKLHGFTLRLGTLFRALQTMPPMSEPEQNQISVTSGEVLLTTEDVLFLREAVKHSVLLEQLGNKSKDAIPTDVLDYQLNPIYAPYFNISFRRKRKLSISAENLIVLVRGSTDEYATLVREFAKVDALEASSAQTRLFE